MAAPTRTPRGEWVEQGLRALAAGGPDAVRIEPLALALGVTRGGFYWHFRDRGALLEEMLDTWERATTQELIKRLDRDGGDAGAKLRRLLALTTPSVVRTDLAIRDWARRDQAVAARLRRVDNRRMDVLRSLFGAFCADPDDIEARCLLAFSLLIGNYFITADHPGSTREHILEHALAQLGSSTPATSPTPGAPT
jgi:AcrR family transcriptional regulator